MPRASASSTMAWAMRSLMLPPGLQCSHLARTGNGVPAARRVSGTSGVFPMASRIDGVFFMSLIVAHEHRLATDGQDQRLAGDDTRPIPQMVAQRQIATALRPSK